MKDGLKRMKDGLNAANDNRERARQLVKLRRGVFGGSYRRRNRSRSVRLKRTRKKKRKKKG